MRIGLIVDGEAEFKSLPHVIAALGHASGNTILRPVLAKLTPTAPLPVIARSCTSALQQLEGRRAERVVVLMDREDRSECIPHLASNLKRELCQVTRVAIDVVVKNRMYENWLVADSQALACQPGRFQVSAADRGRVAPSKADHVDALAMIKRSCLGTAYHKVLDSERVLARADTLTIASNSRSFRRFLRCVGHPGYLQQSKRP